MPVHDKRGKATDVGLRPRGVAQRKPIRVHRVRFAGTGEFREAPRGPAVGICPSVSMSVSRNAKLFRTVTQHAGGSMRIGGSAWVLGEVLTEVLIASGAGTTIRSGEGPYRAFQERGPVITQFPDATMAASGSS